MELREKIVGVARKLDYDYPLADELADAILAIPEIRGALASVALLEGERKIFANYRADMGRLIKGGK